MFAVSEQPTGLASSFRSRFKSSAAVICGPRDGYGFSLSVLGLSSLSIQEKSDVCSRSLPRFFTDPFSDLAKEWSRSRGVGVTI